MSAEPAVQTPSPYDPQRVLGICSWSLRPADARELAAGVPKFGVRRVQLALDPIRENRPGWGEIETLHALAAEGIEIASGMMATAGEDYSTLESIARTGGVRPDATWGANLRAAQSNARLARRLGINLVTFHAGFIPHERGPERVVMIRRLRSMVDVFDDCGVGTPDWSLVVNVDGEAVVNEEGSGNAEFPFTR